MQVLLYMYIEKVLNLHIPLYINLKGVSPNNLNSYRVIHINGTYSQTFDAVCISHCILLFRVSEVELQELIVNFSTITRDYVLVIN